MRGVDLLGELRVAGDVEEEHRHLDGLLLELGGVGILLEQALDGLGHELRQLALELLQELQALARLLQLLQRRPELGVLRLEIGVGLGEPRRHVVERHRHLLLLARARHLGPRVELALLDAAGRPRERAQRPCERAGEDPREHEPERERGEPDLAVAHLRLERVVAGLELAIGVALGADLLVHFPDP